MLQNRQPRLVRGSARARRGPGSSAPRSSLTPPGRPVCYATGALRTPPLRPCWAAAAGGSLPKRSPTCASGCALHLVAPALRRRGRLRSYSSPSGARRQRRSTRGSTTPSAATRACGCAVSSPTPSCSAAAGGARRSTCGCLTTPLLMGRWLSPAAPIPLHSRQRGLVPWDNLIQKCQLPPPSMLPCPIFGGSIGQFGARKFGVLRGGLRAIIIPFGIIPFGDNSVRKSGGREPLRSGWLHSSYLVVFFSSCSLLQI